MRYTYEIAIFTAWKSVFYQDTDGWLTNKTHIFQLAKLYFSTHENVFFHRLKMCLSPIAKFCFSPIHPVFSPIERNVFRYYCWKSAYFAWKSHDCIKLGRVLHKIFSFARKSGLFHYNIMSKNRDASLCRQYSYGYKTTAFVWLSRTKCRFCHVFSS